MVKVLRTLELSHYYCCIALGSWRRYLIHWRSERGYCVALALWVLSMVKPLPQRSKLALVCQFSMNNARRTNVVVRPAHWPPATYNVWFTDVGVHRLFVDEWPRYWRAYRQLFVASLLLHLVCISNSKLLYLQTFAHSIHAELPYMLPFFAAVKYEYYENMLHSYVLVPDMLEMDVSERRLPV